MTSINSETRGAWQQLATDLDKTCPRVGKIVKVTSGKHSGKVGKVIWHGRDRYSDAFRYASEAQAHLRDLAGTYGFRVGIQMESGECFFVGADKVEVQP